MDCDLHVEALARERVRRGSANLIVLSRVDSTNTLARRIVGEYESEAQTLHPLLVLALEQTGGRGRRGRSWSSPRGLGVYATLVRHVADPGALQTLPLLVGVGLCRGLSPHLPAPCRLKWPNDLLVETAGGAKGAKKIGGILVESIVRSGEPSVALIGFGVNQGHEAGDLPETGTSLRLLGGAAVPLAELTWDLVAGVERELEHLGDAGYAVAAYRDLSIHRTGDQLQVAAGEGTIEGRFLGFDDRGLLRLESDGRELTLAAGEVIA